MARRRVNWFAVIVTVAVVIAIVAVGAIIVTQSGPSSSAASASPTSRPLVDDVAVDADAGAVTFGTGTRTVATYVDFLCPYCRQLEQADGETLQKLVADGTITLSIHPVTILDPRSAGTSYSSRAAGAFFAVAEADPAHAYAFFAALFNDQPPENTAGFTDAQLVQVAKKAGVDVTPELERAILTREYQGYAQSHGLPSGARGTPTVTVDGKTVEVAFDPERDILTHLR